MRKFLTTLGLLVALATQAQQTRNPATQAEVDAGSRHDVFVAPDTLAVFAGTIGGATNGIVKLNGFGTNTTLINATANGAFTGLGRGLSNVPGFGSTNVLMVMVDGNNSTGSRGGLPFANLWVAATNSQAGDTIYVYSGTYSEGEHTLPQLPNCRIIGLGKPLLQFSKTNPPTETAWISAIYLPFADNLYVENITIQSIAPGLVAINSCIGISTNHFGATNYLLKDVTLIASGADAMYCATTNIVRGTNYNVIFKAGANCVDIDPINNVQSFHVYIGFDFDAGIPYSSAFHRCINSAVGTNLFMDGRLVSRRATTGNVGYQNEFLNEYSVLVNVVFDIAGTSPVDIDVGSTGNSRFVNCSTLSGAPLVVNNPAFISLKAGGYLGTLNIPMGTSDTDGSGTFFPYGTYQFQDAGTNGTLLITNQNNLLATVPLGVEFRSDVDTVIPGKGIYVNGTVSAYLIVLPTNSVVNLPTALDGGTGFLWNSNSALYWVSAGPFGAVLTTNLIKAH